MKQMPDIPDAAEGKLVTSQHLNRVVYPAIRGLAPVHQIGMAEDAAPSWFILRWFGTPVSVVGNRVTLAPCKGWDDPTPIPGATNVVCLINWPHDAMFPINPIRMGKVYAYLPLPKPSLTPTDPATYGALLPIELNYGCG